MKKTLIAIAAACMMLSGCASSTSETSVWDNYTAVVASPEEGKYYDEQVNPVDQIKTAFAEAKAEGKYLFCQVGANWCVWCTRFAQFIAADEEISKVIDDNFKYIHVNYDAKQEGHEEAMKLLGNPGRFGFPSFVILDLEGNVIHNQDSGLLELDKGYDKAKVLRFFQLWTPAAVTTIK